MKRREFITLTVGAAAWPFMCRAQQFGNVRRIGFLAGSSASASGKDLVECFVSRLRDLGWKDGENIKIDIRWSEGVRDKYTLFAAELAATPLDLVVVTSTPGTLAILNAVRDIPVVFMGVSDPVKSGIVTSLSRPGGNVTGVSNFLPATSGKLFELLALVAPAKTRFGVLHNPDNAGKILELKELQEAGSTLGILVEPIEVRSSNDFQSAFMKISQTKCDGLIVLQEGVTLGGRLQISEYLQEAKLPSIYQIREFVDAGGLMSYGLNYCRHYARAAAYVDKILKGARPADLPIELPTKFELVINLKTARSLGLELPATLLARADEVIE